MIAFGVITEVDSIQLKINDWSTDAINLLVLLAVHSQKFKYCFIIRHDFIPNKRSQVTSGLRVTITV